MIDSIINSVKDQISGKLQSAVGIDASKAGESVKVAGNSMFDTIKSTATSGKLEGLTSLLSNGENNSEGNGILNSINSNIVSSLTQKIGLSGEQASSAGKLLVPILINAFKDKVSGSDGKLDLKSLTSILGTGDLLGNIAGKVGGATSKTGGILDMAKGLFGKK